MSQLKDNDSRAYILFTPFSEGWPRQAKSKQASLLIKTGYKYSCENKVPFTYKIIKILT